MTQPLRGTYKGVPVVEINSGLRMKQCCDNCAMCNSRGSCARDEIKLAKGGLVPGVCSEDRLWIPESQYPVFLLLGIEAVKKEKP